MTDPVHRRAAFDERADEYDAHASIQCDLVKWGRQTLARLLPTLGTASRQRSHASALVEHAPLTLELGAGTGTWTRVLLESGLDVFASDAAPLMLSKLTAALPHVRSGLVDAFGPIAPPPEQPHGWDLVTSASMMQWAPDPVSVLAHHTACLARGGVLYHLFFVAPTLQELFESDPDLSAVHFRQGDEWLRAARQVGLEGTSVWTETRPFTFSSGLHVLRALHGTGAVIRRHTSVSRLRKLIRRYDEQQLTEGGVLSRWTFAGLVGRRG